MDIVDAFSYMLSKMKPMKKVEDIQMENGSYAVLLSPKDTTEGGDIFYIVKGNMGMANFGNNYGAQNIRTNQTQKFRSWENFRQEYRPFFLQPGDEFTDHDYKFVVERIGHSKSKGYYVHTGYIGKDGEIRERDISINDMRNYEFD